MPSIRGEIRRRRVPRRWAGRQRLEERDDEDSDSGLDDDGVDSDSDDEAVSFVARPQTLNQQSSASRVDAAASGANAVTSAANAVGAAGQSSSLALPAAGNRVLALDEIEDDGLESDDDDDEELIVLSPAAPVGTNAVARPVPTAVAAASRATAAQEAQRTARPVVSRPLPTGQQQAAPPVFNADMEDASETAAPTPAATLSAFDPQLGSPQTGTADQPTPKPTFADTRLPQETPSATQPRLSSATGMDRGVDGSSAPGSLGAEDIRGHPFAIAFGTLCKSLTWPPAKLSGERPPVLTNRPCSRRSLSRRRGLLRVPMATAGSQPLGGAAQGQGVASRAPRLGGVVDVVEMVGRNQFAGPHHGPGRQPSCGGGGGSQQTDQLGDV